MARSSEVVPASDDADAASNDKPFGKLATDRAASRDLLHPEITAVTGVVRNTVSRAAMLTGRRWRLAVRWIGLLIFIFGAGLIAYVFLEALHSFQLLSKPGYLQGQINRISGTGAAEITIAIFSVLGAEALRVLYLLLLGVLGSLIAGKGIHFFSASESVIDEAVVAGVDGHED